MAASLWILDLRMASERDHHPVAAVVVVVGLYVDRSGEKRNMCADKAIKVRVKKRTFPKLKQLKSSALSFSPLLVCKLDEWGSGLVFVFTGIVEVFWFALVDMCADCKI
jgi:hypothetical protein